MSVPDLISEWGVYDGHGSISFDFSRIPVAVFTPLIELWRAWLPANVISLDLNCHDLKELRDGVSEAEAGDAIEYPQPIKESIDQGGEYGGQVIDFLKFLLANSKILKSLSISMVDIDINDVRELIEALPTCPSLRKIDLSRIKLSDDGLQLMLKTVRPDQFREIVIQECDVTPASWDAVENYVSHGRISKFSIGDAQWPEESAQELEQLVQSRIDQVVNENALLKEKIQEIRRLVKTGQWSGNRTFAIGPGAEKLKSDLEAASN